MIYIGICDDLAEHRQMLKELCDSYFKERKLKYEAIMFQSGEEILEYTGEQLMLLLLDIEMEGITGIDVMNYIVHSEKIWRIVFVSSHHELMIKTFGLKTLGFCHKPVQYEDVARWLGVALEESDCNKVIQFETGHAINVNDIIYIESEGHYIRVHTIKDNPLFVMDIFKADELLYDTSVIRIHKSYMVNMAYINRITSRSIKLQEGKKELPFGRRYIESVRKKYEDYIYELAKRRSGI